jgi:hypothetical protein
MLSPNISAMQHEYRPAAAMSYLTLVPSGFAGHSQWHILRQIRKAIPIKHLLSHISIICCTEPELKEALYILYIHP